MTDEREPGGRTDASVAAAGPEGDEGPEPIADDSVQGSADAAPPPLQPVRPWLKQRADGSAPSPVSPAPEAVSPAGAGPAPTRQWPVAGRPVGTHPDPGTRPRPGVRPAPLGAGPAPSNEESVLAALQAGSAAGTRADAAGPGDPVPAGRLRRAGRWLFEKAPAEGSRPGREATEDPEDTGFQDGAASGDLPEATAADAASDPKDDGWTAAELAALRADTEPDRGITVDRSVTSRAELARRLAAIHDDPDYDPAGEPVDGSEVRPTVAWDDLATATPVNGTAAATAAPEPDVSSEPPLPPAAPAPEPLVPPAQEAAGPANEAPAQRRPRPRPYAGAPVHYTDEPLPEADPERTVETSHSAVARPAGEVGAAARSRSEEPAAQEKLEKGGPVRGRRTARWLIRTAVLLAIAVVTAMLLRAYVVSPYYIPSASMEPTLRGCSGCNNDHVLVDKLSYRMHDVHRGDVVVFHRPDTWQVPEKTLIKRVVGLPGDRLAVRDGKVYVNGLQLQESYLNAGCPPMTSLSEDPGSPVRTYGPVPPGDLYVMGDNRCDSADSRAFGPVPTSDVIGRAFVIIWPLGRIHWL